MNPPRKLGSLDAPDWGELAFVAGIVHDLNTPLATISTSAELLEQDQESATFDSLVRIIQRQTRRLQTIVQDLSDYVSLESRRIALHPESLDIGAFLRDFRNDFQETAPCHRIDVIVPDSIQVEADAAKLRRIVENLWRNAVKYTPEGSTIVTSVEQHAASPGTVTITIEDNGCGIPEASRTRVFEPFVRLAAGEEGQGLGLHIVRQLAEAHGGAVWVESGSAGGARFCVELPVVCARSTAVRRHA
jgi:signal transduction histidine kinase